jgi:hypothetical protein
MSNEEIENVEQEQEKSEIVPVQPPLKRQLLTPSIWRMIKEIAPVIYKSRLFGVKSADAAAAIMLKGHELGLGITTAFEFIVEIQGRPSLIPRGAWALVLNSGELEKSEIVDELDNNGNPFACSVYLKRKNGLEYISRITMEDARRSGVVKPDSGWQTYPANMLRWRAIGFGLDVVFPDIQGGMKRADEFGATIDHDGNVIETSWSEVPAKAAYQAQLQETIPETTQEPQEDKEAIGIQDLINTHGAGNVLLAVQKVTGGKMPATQEEVEKIAEAIE